MPRKKRTVTAPDSAGMAAESLHNVVTALDTIQQEMGHDLPEGVVAETIRSHAHIVASEGAAAAARDAAETRALAAEDEVRMLCMRCNRLELHLATVYDLLMEHMAESHHSTTPVVPVPQPPVVINLTPEAKVEPVSAREPELPTVTEIKG